MPTAHPLPRHKDAGIEDSTRVGWSIGHSDADQSYCCRVGAMGVVIAGVCRQTDLDSGMYPITSPACASVSPTIK